MERPHRPHRHRSSLEGVIVPSSQPLNRVFDKIILHLEPCQASDIGYEPVTLIKLMNKEVFEKDEFLDLFFTFIQQELLAEETNALRDCLVVFAKYLVDNFFLPLKALAVKTPQPTPALSHSRTPEATIGTPQRVSNLRQACLIRDRHRCAINRKFEAQEGQRRYKRDGPNLKDDDGKSLLEERDNMAFLEVAHIIPHSLMSLTSEEGEGETYSKLMAYRILRMFNPGAIHLINGVDIDRPMNALTLTHDLHKLFDLEVVMKRLLDEDKYADMTISCPGRKFKGHRAIICSQSPFFDAALKGGFREAELSQVDIPDDGDTIACVLSFCYTQNYGQTSDSIDSASDEIARNHLRVYLAADKFGMFPLRELATTRIVKWAKSNWRTENFPDVAQEIWRSTPPHENKLRDEIVEIVSTHVQYLLNQDSLNDILIKNPKFTVAVLKQVVKELTNPGSRRFVPHK
ncbi:hypothetical protein KXX29_007927 [Aspergillus fumigatus]|nr:hypothetical protein KXX29_007927 [Aspergillus fumigatus]KAH2249728.1 hypothetical protein KXW14_004126 [Aspergillus fumigatus]KAH2556693.1 hypothetical protein KXW12_000009 [Aspergillus fumigatus]OXN25529.1 hypothetical protein CDV57_06260 [Aspergillus fumigatus]